MEALFKVADAGTRGQFISILMRGSACDINGNDPDIFVCIRKQRSLHDANQCRAIGCDGQPFHALIRHPSGRIERVALRSGGRTGCGDIEIRRQGERFYTLAGSTVELIYIRTIFVRDEYALAII